MIGLMIGRLTTPDPVELQHVETAAEGLVVWFNSEPKLHGEHIDGTLALLFDALGKAASGQLKVNDKDVNWRIRKTDGGLLLNLVRLGRCAGSGRERRPMAVGGCRSICARNKRGNPRPACTKVPKTGWGYGRCAT